MTSIAENRTLGDSRTDIGDATEMDRRYMRATIEFGRRVLGTTWPNPSVGAIVVRDGVVVGRGLTRPGGRPHAETVALEAAGELARGATMYVSLEPCSHTGLTPPCARAIIGAGIARVVTGAGDPDPRVAGRGHRMMQEAGIEVVTGVLEQEARRANLGHILRVSEGRPLVTLKLAETADGFAAGDIHDGRLMITGVAANNRVQMMRASHDAIMVGAGTVRMDDPLLTVRVPGLDGRKPLRVVLDGHLSISINSRLVATSATHPLVVFCGETVDAEKVAALRDEGVEIAHTATDKDGQVDLRAVLQALGGRGITRVFSEGGPRVGSALIDQGLADEVVLFTSQKPINRHGVQALSEKARALLTDASTFEAAEYGLAGADRMRIWRRRL